MINKVEQIVSNVSRDLLVLEGKDEHQVFVCGCIFENPEFRDDEIHNEFISDELFRVERPLEQAGFIIGDEELDNPCMDSLEVIIPNKVIEWGKY